MEPKCFALAVIAAGSVLAQGALKELTEAALDDNLLKINQLLDAGVDVNGMDEFWSVTPLLAAARKGSNPRAIELLIKRGAQVNRTLGDGLSALIFVACEGPENDMNSKLLAAQLLLSNGANVNQVVGGSRTPLGCAIDQHKPRLAALLKKAGGKEDKGMVDRVHVQAPDLRSLAGC